MPRFLIALFIGFMFVSAACTETITNTIVERDTVTVTVHVRDTVTIPQAIDDTLTTVIVLRHAEKADNSADPDLSADGQLRAEELKRILNLSINTIYTTPFKRTRQTAAPLASQNITLREYAADISADEFAAQIRRENPRKIAVVIGHSNTISPLIKALTNNQIVVPSSETQYDNLYIATLHSIESKVLHLKYGKPTP
jgi:broad specificity phosphatase PhoE